MTSVAIRRGAVPVVLAILIASVWLVTRRADVAAQAATTTTHTRTYLGLDFRPLDALVFPELASNTGGGIYPIAFGNDINRKWQVLLRWLPARYAYLHRRVARGESAGLDTVPGRHEGVHAQGQPDRHDEGATRLPPWRAYLRDRELPNRFPGLGVERGSGALHLHRHVLHLRRTLRAR